MAVKSQDKILCGAALLMLSASVAWTVMQKPAIESIKKGSSLQLPSSSYTPVGGDVAKDTLNPWPMAPAQKSGANWIYDVFTPPEIYYDEASKQFSVTPPETGPVIVPVQAPFGVSLVGVKQDDFRLQLVGYVGKPGDYRGNFENVLSGETIIAKEGKKIQDLGLVIKKFAVNQNRIQSAESMVIIDTEAVAEVQDMETGEIVNLTNKSRLYKGTPIALLKTDESPEPVPYKAGSTFTFGNATYTVGEVTVTPPQVEITKISPDAEEPEIKLLTLGEASAVNQTGPDVKP